MANKYRDLNVVAPPKNRKYIPVLQYSAQRDETGSFSYTVESKSVIPKKIQDGQYGSITLSDGTKLLYFTNEIAGPITYVLLSNGEIYSDTWLFNHIDYVEKNLIDSSNDPLDIIKKLTSDEDIAKVKELVKKLDFDHFLDVSYDSSSNSVTLDMDNVTPYQGEDKVQPQKDNDGNWYLPKTDNAYGELGIGYAQPYTYDSATEHNTILTPDFETITDDAGLKFVRAKKPAEVYPNAVSGDIYPILPAKKEYTGNHLSLKLIPYPLYEELNKYDFTGIFTNSENYYNLGRYASDELAQKAIDDAVNNFNSGKSKIFVLGYGFENVNNVEDMKSGKDFTVLYYFDQSETKESFEEKLRHKTSAYEVVYFGTDSKSFTLSTSSPYSKSATVNYREIKLRASHFGVDKTIGWHNVMSYDGSAWTPKDFMSSITKTYALASGAATEKTDGTGTFYKFDDTMYPFSNSDITDIVCGKNFTVFLLTDGSVWTCGANYRGQLGKGTDADKDILQITPMPIDIGSFTAIAAKEQTWIAIGNNGVLYACGANTFGQFGLGDKKDRSVLTPIADNVERVQLTAGNIIIRKADGTVYGAGYNYDDRLNLNACKCVTEFTKITEVE